MTKRIILSLAVSALILSGGLVPSFASAQSEGAPIVDESGANAGSADTQDHDRADHKKSDHKKGAHKKAAHKKSGEKKGKKKHHAKKDAGAEQQVDAPKTN